MRYNVILYVFRGADVGIGGAKPRKTSPNCVPNCLTYIRNCRTLHTAMAYF